MKHRFSKSTLADRTHRLAALALALVVAWTPVTGAAQEGVQLPSMGGYKEVLPPDQARTFPREFRNVMRQQGVLIDDPIIDSYFSEIGYRLVMHSTGRAMDFHFHVLKIGGINAFAAPAGVVALNGGLILAADTIDEVAGVLAHEVSHVTQSHLARGAEEAARVSIPVMLATLGLVMVGGIAGGLDPEAAQGILMGGQGLAQQAQINYTRQNEAEADRIGIQLLSRAGFDPNGMADFFDTLNRWSRSQGDGPPEYLRTHPLTVSRVAEARDRAQELADRPAHESSDQRFPLIRARLRVLMARHADEAINYFKRRLDAGGDVDEPAMHYGLALAQIDARQLEPARRNIEWLLAREPNNQLFRLALGDLMLAEGQTAQALEHFDSLYFEYGRSRIVALAYAEALLRDESEASAARAAEILEQLMQRDPGDVRVTEMLAHAADKAGDPVLAAEAVANNYYFRGGLAQAIEQLERILERSDLDYYARARISARLDRWRLERLRQFPDGEPPRPNRASYNGQMDVMNRSYPAG